MAEDTEGFRTELRELEDVAINALPNIANVLRAPAVVATSHEGLEGPGRFAPVFAMEAAYAHFTDSIGNRQKLGCYRIEDTAQALREIVNLYRRADGQA